MDEFNSGRELNDAEAYRQEFEDKLTALNNEARDDF